MSWPRLIVLLLSAASQGASAQSMWDEWRDRDPGYRAFLIDLQASVRLNRRDHILRLIRYPLTVGRTLPDGYHWRTRYYSSPAAVRTHFNRIFTPRVRAAILAQEYRGLWGNDRGYMIGNGAIWFDRTCPNRNCRPGGPIRIFTVNN